MKNYRKFSLILFVMLFVLSCKNNNEKSEENFMDQPEMNQSMEPIENDQTDETNEMNTGPTVAEVVESSDEHSTLLKAMRNAGIIVKLNGSDDYTVFAPTNSAFSDLPKGTIDDWMKPENSEELEEVLSYHIIPGNVDSEKLKELIKSNNNSYELVTGNDGKLTASMNDAGNIILTDASGKQSTVVSLDMTASNGVVHSINRVLSRK